jgi:hypothetical protein
MVVMKLYIYPDLIKSEWIKNSNQSVSSRSLIRIQIRKVPQKSPTKPKKLAVEYYVSSYLKDLIDKCEPYIDQGFRCGPVRYYSTPVGCSRAIEKFGFSIGVSTLARLLGF